MSTSEEKKAPPYMERLQKEHCINGQFTKFILMNISYGSLTFLDIYRVHGKAPFNLKKKYKSLKPNSKRSFMNQISGLAVGPLGLWKLPKLLLHRVARPSH